MRAGYVVEIEWAQSRMKRPSAWSISPVSGSVYPASSPATWKPWSVMKSITSVQSGPPSYSGSSDSSACTPYRRGRIWIAAQGLELVALHVELEKGLLRVTDHLVPDVIEGGDLDGLGADVNRARGRLLVALLHRQERAAVGVAGDVDLGRPRLGPEGQVATLPERVRGGRPLELLERCRERLEGADPALVTRLADPPAVAPDGGADVQDHVDALEQHELTGLPRAAERLHIPAQLPQHPLQEMEDPGLDPVH